uniref:Uncharacterized protein n=1 Tax=Salvator merianae TaxID=96440 RepID=A0A8D0C1M2_SALMN
MSVMYQNYYQDYEAIINQVISLELYASSNFVKCFLHPSCEEHKGGHIFLQGIKKPEQDD